MRERARTRAIYLGTIAAMAALTAGMALAVTIGSIPSPPAQGGGYTAAGTPPTNVATTGAKISQAASASSATTNTLGSPKVLSVTTSSGTDTVAMNAVTAGDYVETITITLTAGSPNVAASTEYSVSLFIAGATSSPQLVYIETSSTFGSSAVDTVNLVYDIGSGSSAITITSVSDLITQCSAVGSC